MILYIIKNNNFFLLLIILLNVHPSLIGIVEFISFVPEESRVVFRKKMLATRSLVLRPSINRMVLRHHNTQSDAKAQGQEAKTTHFGFKEVPVESKESLVGEVRQTHSVPF